MKPPYPIILLGLTISSLLSAQAATTQVDFGRTDSTTTGAVNISFTTPSSPLGDMQGTVTASWSTAGYPVGDNGYVTTKTTAEENGWKNAFGGSLPFSMGDSFRDGLLTQTSTGSGTFTITFTGLEAGNYSLSLFGGFTGKDAFASQTWSIGGADTTSTIWNNFATDASGNWGQLAGSTGATSGLLNAGNAQVSNDALANKGLYSTADNIVVGADGTLTLTMQGNGSTSYGRTALNGLFLTKQVPEPTTTTLGMLGLITLCLIRRRQA